MKKTNMRFSLVCLMALGLMLSGTSAQVQEDAVKPINYNTEVQQFQQHILLEDLSQDCQYFKLECEDFCLNQNPTSDGVWTSECWGSPLYVDCKCSDKTVHNVPGFECKNEECKTLAITNKKATGQLPSRTRGPIRRPTVAAPPDCDRFKAECVDLCLNHNPGSDGVWASECWGTPLYAECKCSDATIFKIPGFACKNPECPVEVTDKNDRTKVRRKPALINRKKQTVVKEN